MRYEHTIRLSFIVLIKKGLIHSPETFSGDMFKEKLLKCLTGLTNGVGIVMCSDDIH